MYSLVMNTTITHERTHARTHARTHTHTHTHMDQYPQEVNMSLWYILVLGNIPVLQGDTEFITVTLLRILLYQYHVILWLRGGLDVANRVVST